MPLVTDDSQQLPEGARAALPPPSTEVSPAPSALDVAAAAEHTANIAGMAYDRVYEHPRPDAPFVPDFDRLSSVPKGYEPYADRFLDAQSPQEVDWIKQRIDSELQDRQTIARAGGWGVAATLASGATDPLTIASMALPGGGATRLGAAVRLAAINVGATAAQEFVAHQFSVLRTPEESLTNIGAGAILGGILGAAIRPRVPLSEFEKLRANLDTDLRVPPTVNPGMESTAGAAAVAKPDITANTIAPGGKTIAEGVIGQVAPGLRLLTSPSNEARELVQQLAETREILNKNLEGIATPTALETVLRGYEGDWYQALKARQEAFRTYRERIANTDEAPLSRSEFGQEIAYAMRRGDRSDIPEVAAAAAKTREIVFDPLKERAQKLGLLPDVEKEAQEAAEREAIGKYVSAESSQIYGDYAAGARSNILSRHEFGKNARRLIEEPGNYSLPEAEDVANSIRDLRMQNAVRIEGGGKSTVLSRAAQRQKTSDMVDAAYEKYSKRLQPDSEAAFQRRAEAARTGTPESDTNVLRMAKLLEDQANGRILERVGPIRVRSRELPVVGAESYLMRQYDARKIRTNLSQWYDTLTKGFVQQGVDQVEARDLAYQATRNVLGSERGTMDWKVREPGPPGSGRFEERTLRLPDAVLEPFLNSDIDHLTHSYLRTMAPEVEMTERFGSRDLRDQLDDVKNEYARLSEKAVGNDTMLAELDKRRDADIRDLSAIRDRLYGIYGQPKDPGSWFVRGGRLLRSDNALRLLGAATLAHIPDIANVITRYGLPNTFKAIGKLATSWNAIQVTRAEARRLGVGLDMVMNTTAALLGDYGSHSQFLEQRVMAKFMRGYTILTGETPLISTIQSLASVVGQDELLRNAEKIAAGKLLSQRTMAKLASAGMDRPMLEKIAAQAAQHGQEVNGLLFGMSDKWTDQAAAQAFESAILKDAHAMTLSPGAGDTPLLMSTELGKLLLQFKSFAFAASRHVLLPLAQGVAAGDVRAMTGMLSLATAGFLSYAAKQKAAGQPIETDNAGRLALEVLDKSNLLGWTGEMIYPGMWQLGFKDMSRWSDRDAVETLLGPSMGTVASSYSRRLPSKAFGNQEEPDQTFSRSDLHFLRRLAPGQNLWYFRRAVNGLEDSVGDLFNLPGTSNADRALAAK